MSDKWYNRYISKMGQQCPSNYIGEIQMASVKVGSFYTTSVSGINGIVAGITARGNRKVVELLTLDGNVFSTLPKGIRAKVSA
jgi:hypothetical protein